MNEKIERLSLKTKKYDLLYAILCAAIIVFFVYIAQYGYNGYDESFYLTVPYRLVQGDTLLYDEWHPAQLAGFVMYPVMWLYMNIAESTDGMILTFRYIYIAAQTMAAIYIYLRLKKFSPIGAISSSLVYFLFVPYYRLSLSYNSIAIMLLLLAGITASTARSGISYTVSGLMFAGAVLCCPYLAIVYVFYTAVIIIYSLIKDSYIKEWLYFTCGCAMLALLFSAVLLKKATPEQLIEGIRNTLNDPEHGGFSVLEVIGLYVKHMCFSRLCARVSSFGCLIIIVLIKLDKRRYEHSWAYMLASTLICIGYLALSLNGYTYRYINYYMVPLSVPGISAYLLHKKRPKRIFWLVFVSGWIFSFFKCLSSNQFYYALSEGLCVSCAASAFFIGSWYSEYRIQYRQKGSKENISAMISLVSIAMLSCMLVRDNAELCSGNCRTTGIDLTANLTEKMSGGVADGLLATYEENHNYQKYLEETKEIRSYKGKNVLYFSWEMWLYLMDSKENAAFSAWLSFAQPDIAVERMLEYWRLNPEKKPDAMFIDKDFTNAEQYMEQLNTEKFPIKECELGYILLRPEC